MSVATVKPIISPGFMRRGQIDLIDVTVDPDGDFKYIGHYIDHFTKFNFLWPQHRKKSVEVARCLIKNVFSVVGLPLILQHDNGKEFCNKVRTLPKVSTKNLLLLFFYFLATDHSKSC